MPLDHRRKVAIVGFCSTSRDLAPYEDGEWEIWGLNRGVMFMSRADRWFDMHNDAILTSQERRPGRHVEFLRNFKGPVYVHKRFDFLGDNQVVYPLAEVAANLGLNVLRIGKADKAGNLTDTDKLRDTADEPYLSSSIAYEIALAIVEGFEEIALVGVDLNTESEYVWQRPGVEYLIGVAAGRGIKVLLPDNCPMLRGTLYGRGFMSDKPEAHGYAQFQTRMAALQHDAKVCTQEIARATGALQAINEIAGQMVPGIDHELMEDRRKAVEKVLQQLQVKQLQIVGQLKETQYWVHQTMEGQAPTEAIAQIRRELDQGVNGPVTDLDELQTIDPTLRREPAPEDFASGTGGRYVTDAELAARNAYIETYGEPVAAD